MNNESIKIKNVFVQNILGHNNARDTIVIIVHWTKQTVTIHK